MKKDENSKEKTKFYEGSFYDRVYPPAHSKHHINSLCNTSNDQKSGR